MTDLNIAPAKEAKDAPTRVSDRVAERLMSMIASGSLAPGQRLPGERQLAETMGVSRVSVRAALQKLKTQGFLSAVQGGGTRVISSANTMDPALTQLVRVNQENLHDLAEIRAIIEVWAARRAATNAKAEHITEMETILDAMASRGEQKAVHDVRFHLTIAKASGSAIYMHIVGVIRDIMVQMLDYHRYELFHSGDEDRKLLAQHRAIVERIRGRDPEGAAEAMHQHLQYVLDQYQTERQRHAVPQEGV